MEQVWLSVLHLLPDRQSCTSRYPHSRFFHLCHGFTAQVLYCHLPGSLSDTAGLAYPVSIVRCLVWGLGLDSHQRRCPQLPRSAPIPALHAIPWFSLLHLRAWLLVMLLGEERLFCLSKVSHSPVRTQSHIPLFRRGDNNDQASVYSYYN